MIGFALMKHIPRLDTMQAVEVQVISKAGEYNAQEIANTLWSYATLGLQPGSAELVDALERYAALHMPEFQAQEMANFLWAYAKLGIQPKADVVLALEVAAMNLHEDRFFNLQGISMVIWSFASLSIAPSAPFMARLWDRGADMPRELTPQNISNLLWACTKLGTMSPHFFASLELYLPGKLKDFNAHAIATALWAYSVLGVSIPDPIMQGFDEVIMSRMGSLKGLDISQILVAHANMSIKPPSTTMLRLEEQIVSLISDLSASHIKNILWSYAKFHQAPRGSLFLALENQIGRLEMDARGVDFSAIMWAYGMLRLPPDAMFTMCEARIHAIVKEQKDALSAMDVANCLWAFAAAGRMPSEAFLSTICGIALRMLETGTANSQDAWNIHLFLLSVELERCQSQLSIVNELRIRLGDRWKNSMMGRETSGFEHDVYVCLTRLTELDYTFQESVVDPMSGHTIDILLEAKDRENDKKIALDIVGSDKFILGSARLMGNAHLKQRHLEKLGYVVKQVSFRDWSNLPNQQDAIVLELLRRPAEAKTDVTDTQKKSKKVKSKVA